MSNKRGATVRDRCGREKNRQKKKGKGKFLWGAPRADMGLAQRAMKEGGMLSILKDAGLLRRQVWTMLEGLGVDLSRGDMAFALDLNETTDEELSGVGFPEKGVPQLRRTVARLQAQTKTYDLRTAAFDKRQKWCLENGTKFEKLMASARLLAFLKPLYRVGVERPADLTELTKEDLERFHMYAVPRRRFRSMLRRLPAYSRTETLTFISNSRERSDFNGRRRHGQISEEAAAYLFDQVRLNGQMIEQLDRYHGVENLQDLSDVSSDMLHDVGAKALHIRRFQRALASIQQAVPRELPHVCLSTYGSLLHASRLGRFAPKLAEMLGVRTISDLLELQRADLLAVGLGTLPRRRFYLLQKRVAVSASCQADAHLAISANDRRTLRNQAQEKLTWMLRRKLRSMRFILHMQPFPETKPLALPEPLTTAIDCFGNVSNGTSLRVAHSKSWAPWTTLVAPWPTRHPDGLQCKVGMLRLPESGVQPMCLNPKDHISKHLAAEGRWRDCAGLVREWKRADGGDPAGTFLE